MTCPNCRGETHRYDRHLVCSAGCGWLQDAPRVEPRRPQVGDDVVLLFDEANGGPPPIPDVIDRVWAPPTAVPFFTTAKGYQRPYYDNPGSWRWPATQGAAVAGPARCLCGHVGAEACLFGEPPPPASEPPPGDMTLFLSQEVEAQRKGVQRERERADAATAARAALEVQLAEALTLVAPFGGGDLLVGIRHLQRSLDREIEEHQRHHDNEDALRAELAAERTAHEATLGHLRGKQSAYLEADGRLAALEVQLRDEASAAMDMIQDWSGKWCDMRDERDALAAQLKALREAMIDVTDRLESASALLEQEGLGDPGRRHTPAGDVEAIAHARAALAASGPAKEGA